MRLLTTPVCTALALAMVTIASPTSAQELGARVGASIEPDQFYFGAHAETGPVADRVHFRPNVEFGVGSDTKVIALNFELVYRFPTDGPWGVFAGGGPALNIIDVPRGDTEAEGGITFVVGVQHRQGLFIEAKGGAIDSPNFKVGVGYVFRYGNRP